MATSGTTGAEGESIGNSWKFSHLVKAFCTQWGDAALAARDAKARKSEAVVAAVDNFDLSELSEAAARIENAISWNDTDPQIVEHEDDDDDNCEEDVDWYAGDCDDELEESQNFTNSLLAIWKMLMRPHLKCMLRLGIGAFDGLAQPSTDRKPVKVSWQRQEGQEDKKVLFSAKNTELTCRVSSSNVQEASD